MHRIKNKLAFSLQIPPPPHLPSCFSQSWRRLSSLQRTLCLLVVCSIALFIFYNLPDKQVNSETRLDKLKTRNLPEDSVPEEYLRESHDDLEKNLQALKQKVIIDYKCLYTCLCLTIDPSMQQNLSLG